MCGRFALHAHPDVVALQFDLDAVTAHAVDARVGDPVNDDAGLVEPLRGGPLQTDLR